MCGESGKGSREGFLEQEHWLASPRAEGCQLHLFAGPSLRFYSLHQVHPGVVLGNLKHVPGPTHQHDPAGQDNPEAS